MVQGSHLTGGTFTCMGITDCVLLIFFPFFYCMYPSFESEQKQLHHCTIFFFFFLSNNYEGQDTHNVQLVVYMLKSRHMTDCVSVLLLIIIIIDIVVISLLNGFQCQKACKALLVLQAPVVQTLDSPIQWIVQSVFLILIRRLVIYPMIALSNV